MALNNSDSFVKVCIKLDELRFKGNIDWRILGKKHFQKPETKIINKDIPFLALQHNRPILPLRKNMDRRRKSNAKHPEKQTKNIFRRQKTDAKHKNRQQRKHNCRNTYRRKNLQTRKRRLPTTQKHIQLPLNLQPNTKTWPNNYHINTKYIRTKTAVN